MVNIACDAAFYFCSGLNQRFGVSSALRPGGIYFELEVYDIVEQLLVSQFLFRVRPSAIPGAVGI